MGSGVSVSLNGATAKVHEESRIRIKGAPGRFAKDDFTFNAVDNMYRCPAAEAPTYRLTGEQHNLKHDVYWTTKCVECPIRLNIPGVLAAFAGRALAQERAVRFTGAKKAGEAYIGLLLIASRSGRSRREVALDRDDAASSWRALS